MPLPILLFAAQAAQPAPPPPMMTTNVSPPPVVVDVGPNRPRLYAIPEANNAPPDMIDIKVRAGSDGLWAGRLRVARPGASLIQHINETAPDGCPPDPYGGSVHSSLTVSVLRNKLSITPEGAFNYHVRVSWERPSSARGCANEGARKVEVSQGIDLRPGQAATLKGDSGLVVEVRRR
jgi:hypothetical protein